MSYSLDFVKEVIEEFLKTNHVTSIELSEGLSGRMTVNKSIFDIESFLVQLRQDYNINTRLDTSIVSENILKHFNSISPSTAYRAVDYQLNFLHHLAIGFLPDKDLFTLIDEFIDKFKNQFTLADIVLTKTGATRCKTNIRFSVDGLRDLGLVLSRDKKEKRSWAPAIMGLVVLLNIRFNHNQLINYADFKQPDSLLTFNERQRLKLSHSHDPTLVNSIQMFNSPEHLYLFLNQLQINTNSADKVFLEGLIMEYINFVEEGLEITNTGVKTTKVFEDRSLAFQKRIFSIEDGQRDLHAKLFKYFR